MLGKIQRAKCIFTFITTGILVVMMPSSALAGCNGSLNESMEQASMCRGSYNLACHYVRVRADVLQAEYIRDAINANKGKISSNIGQKATENLVSLLENKIEYLEDEGPSCLKASTMGRQIVPGFIIYPKDAVLSDLIRRLNSENIKYINNYIAKHAND